MSGPKRAMLASSSCVTRLEVTTRIGMRPDLACIIGGKGLVRQGPRYTHQDKYEALGFGP
jgi:hypothetical protein